MLQIEIPIMPNMIINGELIDDYRKFDIPEVDDFEALDVLGNKICNKSCRSFSNGFTICCLHENCLLHEVNREYLVMFVQMQAHTLKPAKV